MTSDDATARGGSRTRRLGTAAAYAAATAVALFGAGFLVRSRWGPLVDADAAAVSATTSATRDHPHLLDALVVWQRVTEPRNLYVVGLLICLWVWFGKGLRTRAWWAFGTMMLAWFVGFAAKLVVQRARPIVEDPVSEAPGFSFPSGHALNSAAFATAVVILLWPVVTAHAWRAVIVTAAVVVVALTALDRVFLGVHYPSDVAVGVLTGVGLVLASYAGYVGWNPPDVPGTAEDPDTGSTTSAGSRRDPVHKEA
jgi:membrane-associated phospholipid phosphatase